MSNQDFIHADLIKVKKQNKFLWGAVAVLCILLIYFIFTKRTATVEVEEAKVENVQLKDELELLMSDYNFVKNQNEEFASQMSEKDSVIMVNAKEIRELIALKADYSKIKKKLDLLRNITQDYVQRMDSLIVVNQELTSENIQIKEEISSQKSKNKELNEFNKQLETQVSVASAFKAYNIKAGTFRLRAGEKEVATDKAKRIDRIKICFTLSENKIVEAGLKTIYCRIARPDGLILVESDEDTHSFSMDGRDLQFSIAKEIQYENVAQEVCLMWDRKDNKKAAMVGIYSVSLFLDGKEIGRTSFEVGS